MQTLEYHAQQFLLRMSAIDSFGFAFICTNISVGDHVHGLLVNSIVNSSNFGNVLSIKFFSNWIYNIASYMIEN